MKQIRGALKGMFDSNGNFEKKIHLVLRIISLIIDLSSLMIINH